MTKTALFITLFIVCISTSCNSCKENVNPEKQCWGIYEGEVFNITTSYYHLAGHYCDLTEKEFLNCDTCGSYNGRSGRIRDIVGCKYASESEAIFYWEVKVPSATTYAGNYFMTQREANCVLSINGNMIRKK
jgi:hypothetical protein